MGRSAPSSRGHDRFFAAGFDCLSHRSRAKPLYSYHLDIRRPQPYRVAHPDAIRELDALPPSIRDAIGPDLAHLARDANFQNALRTSVFYKQPWDEAFQLRRRSVIFGYRPSLAPERSPFILIRFPRALAEALTFQAMEMPLYEAASVQGSP